MAIGCDTATIVTTARLNTIIDEGLTFVGRYLNYLAGYHDNITITEAEKISDAGLYIVSLYQNLGTTGPTYFTSAHGTADANDAINYAAGLGQPSGTPIYFTVDFDVTLDQIRSYIVPYFQAIVAVLANSSLNPNGYKLGIYGSRLVCGYIRGSYSPTERYTWIAGSTGWAGTFDDWNLHQYNNNTYIGSGTGRILIDYDESASYGGGGWKL